MVNIQFMFITSETFCYVAVRRTWNIQLFTKSKHITSELTYGLLIVLEETLILFYLTVLLTEGSVGKMLHSLCLENKTFYCVIAMFCSVNVS